MTKNKFQLKREQTYRKLLDAGMEVFCEQGYAATTLEHITSRAGYTKGAFYVHFQNKQDFFFQLMNDQGFFFNNDDFTNADERNIVNVDLKSTVRFWTNNVLQRYMASKWTLVFYDFYIQNRHDEKVQVYFRDYHQKWVDDIQRIIDGLKMKKWIRTDRDSRKLAICCYDIITGSIIHHHMCGEPSNPNDVAEAIVALLT